MIAQGTRWRRVGCDTELGPCLKWPFGVTVGVYTSPHAHYTQKAQNVCTQGEKKFKGDQTNCLAGIP